MPLAVDDVEPLEERSEPEPELLILEGKVVVADEDEDFRDRDRAEWGDPGLAVDPALTLRNGVVVCKLWRRLSNDSLEVTERKDYFDCYLRLSGMKWSRTSCAQIIM